MNNLSIKEKDLCKYFANSFIDAINIKVNKDFSNISKIILTLDKDNQSLIKQNKIGFCCTMYINDNKYASSLDLYKKDFYSNTDIKDMERVYEKEINKILNLYIDNLVLNESL